MNNSVEKYRSWGVLSKIIPHFILPREMERRNKALPNGPSKAFAETLKVSRAAGTITAYGFWP